MRYYDLALTPPGSTTPARHWTSHPNGQMDPGALNIEVDAIVAPYATPVGASTVIVHGLSLTDLRQAPQWGIHADAKTGNLQPGMTLMLKAGMKAGLPLANPLQSGIILSGMVVEAFGNWEGTEMDAAFVVQPAIYSEDMPGNIVLNWKAGTELSTALQHCLSIAYPGFPITMRLSSNMVLPYDQVHAVHTLTGLASWLRNFTAQRMLNPVEVAIQGGQIIAFDSLYVGPTKQLAFTDLVGQPTWIAPRTMQAKFVMRADLQIGDTVQMPRGLQSSPGLVQMQAAAWPGLMTKSETTFQGAFKVKSVRHIGNFRTPDGSSWVTVVNCVELGAE